MKNPPEKVSRLNCSTPTPTVRKRSIMLFHLWKRRSRVIPTPTRIQSDIGRVVFLIAFGKSPNLRITLPARQTRVPEKFPLAMDVLPIQDSAVPCERVFSSGALTDTARRNKLSPELMEALQMLKFALKKSRLDFTAGKSKEDELQELEEVDLTPLDIRAFVQSLAVDTKS
jgi:hypothetical protein